MGEKQVEIVVKDYLRTLRNNKIVVERAILYGSQAVDTANQAFLNAALNSVYGISIP
jgi:hypothetical protein